RVRNSNRHGRRIRIAGILRCPTVQVRVAQSVSAKRNRVFRIRAVHIEQRTSRNPLDKKRQSKRFIAKVVVYTIRKIWKWRTQNSAVIGIYASITVYVLIAVFTWA